MKIKDGVANGKPISISMTFTNWCIYLTAIAGLGLWNLYYYYIAAFNGYAVTVHLNIFGEFFIEFALIGYIVFQTAILAGLVTKKSKVLI